MTDETESSVEDTRRALRDCQRDINVQVAESAKRKSGELSFSYDSDAYEAALAAHEAAIRRKERRDVLAPSVEDDDCRCK